ncbi:DUF1800 domain-containing protein [Roseococcus pinisoli]|uniref:DUF1800 domain-containing protein n=1 Tax=Roseococcus pinisoli TaxID=2835040 RepID=A0ABS5QH81_9PROT|nr:DUF1800 domain-containing protein [Roseococcus pinisoli]MBS7813027.1 DUF1800 domain-containing protein [Roseococcus pinisoli]
MTPLAAHAAIRFGLGNRPEAQLPADPRAWLTGQISPLPEAPGPSLAEAFAAQRQRQRDPTSQAVSDLFRTEALAWSTRMITTTAPFAERWANFWTNHLTTSRRAGQATVMLGHYQRLAIRAHAFGRFEDMLLAAYRHPAMLFYLDQSGSIGPSSPAGQRARRGLNENLARECMELHTVTPAAGYSQEDVTTLARLLTGWSVGRGAPANEPEGFLFRARAHEPGDKILLGRTFPEGEEGGAEALRFLAGHPATHHALALKLARHFVADAPPAPAVARIEAALRDSGGDLAAAARAVVAAPEARAPLRKLRSGQDYAIAVLRALGLGDEGAPMLLGTLARLNQPLWTAPAPIGWSDEASEWAAPEQLMRRLDWASEIAGRTAAAGVIEPEPLGEVLLGPLARAETMAAARRAGSVREGLLLLLASPEAQRR